MEALAIACYAQSELSLVAEAKHIYLALHCQHQRVGISAYSLHDQLRYRLNGGGCFHIVLSGLFSLLLLKECEGMTELSSLASAPAVDYPLSDGEGVQSSAAD